MSLVTAATRHLKVPGRLRLARAVSPLLSPPGGLLLSRLPDGTLMEFDLSDDLQVEFHYLGEYEATERAYILSVLPADGVFLDLGANIGWHTIPAARHLAAGSVHAFEPLEWNVRRIHRNLALNRLTNVVVHPVALSDTTGNAEVYSEFPRSGNASLAPGRDGAIHQATIRCVRLDSWITDHPISRIDMVKVDVEGAELRALRGMTETLRSRGLPPILCEINPILLSLMGTSADELIEEAGRIGYTPHRLRSGSRLEPLRALPGHDVNENIVFTRGR